ncbi:MAG: NfeD family protein [Baekduia sp.]
MESWVWWVIAAVALTAGELTITGFFLAPFALGAAVALLVDLLVDGWLPPWIAFAVGTLVGFLLIRPIAKRHLTTPPEIRTGTAALVGHTATVTQDVDNDRNQGAIRLDEGEVWTARTEDGGQPLAAGARVSIVAIRGATAIVEQA